MVLASETLVTPPQASAPGAAALKAEAPSSLVSSGAPNPEAPVAEASTPEPSAAAVVNSKPVGTGEVSQAKVAAKLKEVRTAAYGRIMHLLDGETLDPEVNYADLMMNILKKHPADKDALLAELPHLIPLALEEAKASAKAKTPAAVVPEAAPISESTEEIQNKINAAEREAVKLCAEAIKQGMWDPGEANITTEEISQRQDIRKAIQRYQAQFEVHEKARLAIEAEVQLAVRNQNKTLTNDNKPPMDDATQKAFEAEFRQHEYSRDGKTKKILNTVEEKWFQLDSKTDIFTVRDGHGRTVDIFHRPDNTPILMTAMRELAGKKDAGGKPTPEALAAQKQLSVLKNYLTENGRGFIPKTAEQVDIEKAHKEIFDTAYRVVAHFLGEDITAAFVADGKYDIAKVLDKIKEYPNMPLADLATSIYIYHHGGAKNDPAIQGNIDASLYYQLQGLTEELNAKNPELAVQIKNLSPHQALMEKRFRRARSIVKGFLIADKITVGDEKILRILSLSTFFEEHTEITREHGLRLKEDARSIILQLRQSGILSEADEQAITHLAHNNAGSGLFNKLYGVEIKSFLSGTSVTECVTFVIDELIKQNHLPENKREIGSQVLEVHMTATGLKRLNMNMEIFGYASGPLLLFALFAGAIQNILGTGVSTEEERGG